MPLLLFNIHFLFMGESAKALRPSSPQEREKKSRPRKEGGRAGGGDGGGWEGPWRRRRKERGEGASGNGRGAEGPRRGRGLCAQPLPPRRLSSSPSGGAKLCAFAFSRLYSPLPPSRPCTETKADFDCSASAGPTRGPRVPGSRSSADAWRLVHKVCVRDSGGRPQRPSGALFFFCPLH